jgi:DNA-binding XRE family transcriptional regulator
MTASEATSELRQRLRASQTELANHIGVNLVTIARHEAGQAVKPRTLAALHKLAMTTQNEDLSSAYRGALKGLKGRASMQVEAQMITDALQWLWREFLCACQQELKKIDIPVECDRDGIPDREQEIRAWFFKRSRTFNEIIEWSTARHREVDEFPFRIGQFIDGRLAPPHGLHDTEKSE